MISAIIFDCFGVLIGSSLQTLTALCPADSQAMLDDIVRRSDYGLIDRKQFTGEIAALLGLDPTEVETIISAKRLRNQPLIDEVARLRRSYKTAMLSNIGSDVVEHLFTGEELSALFDTVVLSYRVGMAKPDRAIYELTAKKLGVTPSECLMIDDRPIFCDGAVAIGMRALHYRSNDQLRAELVVALA